MKPKGAPEQEILGNVWCGSHADVLVEQIYAVKYTRWSAAKPGQERME